MEATGTATHGPPVTVGGMSTTSPARPLRDLVHPSWADALAPVEPAVARLGEFLRGEVAAGRGYLPGGPHILRAFERPLDAVRVLIVGQDPYPTPGHAVGLSFSVAPDVRPRAEEPGQHLPRAADRPRRCPPRRTGDLTPWADQGVLLLNRVLTVAPGKPASHRGKGWETVTARAIEALVERGGPLVAVLWGSDARGLGPQLPGIPCIESPHPSPLSAHAGFFGSRPVQPRQRPARPPGRPTPSTGGSRDDPPPRPASGPATSRSATRSPRGCPTRTPTLPGRATSGGPTGSRTTWMPSAERAHLPFGYANLAVRGRKLDDVVGTQLDAAMSM